MNDDFKLPINKYSLKFLFTKLEEDFQSNLNKLTTIHEKIGAVTVFAFIIIPLSFISYEFILGYKENNAEKMIISIGVNIGLICSLIIEIVCFFYNKFHILKGIFFIFILFVTFTEYSRLYQAISFGITISTLNAIVAIIYLAIAYNKRWFISGGTTSLGNVYFLVRYLQFGKISTYQKLLLIGTVFLVELYFIFIFYLNELLLREHFFLMNEIKKKKNFFKKVLKEIPASIFVYVNDKLDMLNNTMKQMLGITLHEDNDIKKKDINEKEKEYKKYLDRITNNDGMALSDCLKNLNRNQNGISNEDQNLFYLNKNDQKFKVKLNSVDYNDSEREVKIYVLEDYELTSRITKETEEKYKKMMMASLSHEIFTPINGITGIIETIDQSMFDKVTKKKFTSIKNSCSKFMYYISILKYYTMIESQSVKLENTSFDVIEKIKNIVELFRRDLKAKKIGLSLNLMYSRIGITFDQDKFSQIIFCLMENALKHTFTGSINLNLNIESDRMYLSIEDTGEGISSEKIKNIFDMFVISSQTNEINPQGIGMHLYVCQRLAHAMGTEIKVSSLFGQGATFSICIHCDNLRNAVEEEKEEKLEHIRSEREIKDSQIVIEDIASFQKIDPLISENRLLNKEQCSPYLVVDDDSTNVYVLQEFFQSINMNCEVAYNGKEAIELIQAHVNRKCCNGFKIIMMDINMPIMDGEEATRIIRRMIRNQETQDKVIIGITAAQIQDQAHKQKFIDAGFNEMYNKPLRKKTFLEIIQKYNVSN